MKYRRIRFGKIGDHPTVDFAIQELLRCVKQMDPELIVEVLQTQFVDERFRGVIWVGLDSSLTQKVPSVENSELDDAISIFIQNDHGWITGSNYRSVLIAAYRFLKELGCDWVRPGREGERIPNREVADINMDIVHKASYRHRGVCIEGANSYENVADMIDYLPKVGMNEYFIQYMIPVRFFARWYMPQRNPYQEHEPLSREEAAAMTVSLEADISKRGLRYHKTGHGWTCEPFGVNGTGWDDGDCSDLDETTRQYFAEVNGQRGIWKNMPLHTNLCYSNPKVRDMMTDAITQYCQENSQVDVLHFWLGDEINNQCECENCRKKSASDWYVVMLNELDAKLTNAGLNTKVVFLLYYDLLWAPEQERLTNPDRFILMFAPITRMYGRNYTDDLDLSVTAAPYVRNQLQAPKTLAENLAYLRSWQEQFSGDSFVYDYHLMWAHVADPGYEFCARNLFEDMKNLDKIGINGMVSCQVQRCAFPTALPFNMMASALWDKNCDYEKEMQAYYRSAFGENCAEVHRYLGEISRLIRVYESVASGHPVFDNKPLCVDYEAVAEAVRRIRPVIEQNLNGVHRVEWQTLQLHTEYVLRFVACLEQLEKGDLPALKKSGLALGELINRSEPLIQKQMDGFNTHRITHLRLGLRKSVLDSIPD